MLPSSSSLAGNPLLKPEEAMAFLGYTDLSASPHEAFCNITPAINLQEAAEVIRPLSKREP